MKNYKPKNNYDWIKVLPTPPELDYTGHYSVISMFNNYVKPLMKKNSKVLNLGSARGEVMGLLQKESRDEFYDTIKKNCVKFTKVDIQYYPEEENLVSQRVF